MRTITINIPESLALTMYQDIVHTYKLKKEKLEEMKNLNKSNPPFPCITFIIEEEVDNLSILLEQLRENLEL